MRKKRILFGAVDIGYRIQHYSKFIKSNLNDKLEVESFSKYVLPKEHYETEYTYSCPIDKTHPWLLYMYSFGFFIFSLFRYDIFHFLSGETILTRKLRRFEFKMYKLFGKRIIMHFVGADIRSVPYLDWKSKHLYEYLKGEKGVPLTEKFQDKLISDTRKYADCIIVTSPDLLEIIPEAKFFPVLLDLEQIQVENEYKRHEEKITILFSPSSHRTKGSSFVHDVLERIIQKAGESVEVVIPGKKILHQNKYPLTRYNMLSEMQKAHIVVDQMLIGWYGLKSVEALASGCEVICYIDEKFKSYQFPESPIISSDITTLEEDLLSLINKVYNKRIRSEKNLNWVKQYHTIEKNNRILLEAWDVI